VKTTIFLRDMADFQAVNEVYGRALGESRPARSTVAVAGLPRDVRVEIEVVALIG
jgi:2-iminobutanoate/2-iminopropanoate deaminase